MAFQPVFFHSALAPCQATPRRLDRGCRDRVPKVPLTVTVALPERFPVTASTTVTKSLPFRHTSVTKAGYISL